MKKQLKLLALTMIAFICFPLFAGQWIPRDTLKNALNVYECPSSNCEVVARVPQGVVLDELESSESVPKWLFVSFADGSGFVYKGSIQPFEKPIDIWKPITDSIIGEIEIHRVNRVIYFSIGTWCYYVDSDQLRYLPEGKEKAMRLSEFIESQGGLLPLSEQEKQHCIF